MSPRPDPITDIVLALAVGAAALLFKLLIG
jgi:hypothetical protein